MADSKIAESIGILTGRGSSSSALNLTGANRALMPRHGDRPRLDFLDGLRGFASLFVVFYHLHQEVALRNDLPARFLAATKWLQLGPAAVGVFIVISGYCLMIPVARSTDGRLRGGLLNYLKRRAKRILPPYYAAICFSLALISVIPGLRHPRQSIWDIVLPATTFSAIASHLFMVHNLNPNWIYKIDAPLWSVATEWQIYFLFPLLLLPVFRHAGILAAAVAAVFLGIGCSYLCGDLIEKAAPWYLGLFAMGMFGAFTNFSESKFASESLQRIPWGSMTMLFGAMLAALIKIAPQRFIIGDGLCGLAAMSLIIYCTSAVQRSGGGGSFLLCILQSRVAVWLGVVSYSLYLIHYPLIAVASLVVDLFAPSPMLRACLIPLVALPLIFPAVWLFHITFERPFMGGHPNSARQAAVSAVLEPGL